MKKEVTTTELFEAMSAFSEEVTRQFDACAKKEDLKNLVIGLVTKEDAQKFLTKEDAKNFLTKEDAKAFATKDDLSAFATKEDLLSLRDDIRHEIGKVISLFSPMVYKADRKVNTPLA